MQTLQATLPAQTAGGGASRTNLGVLSSVAGTNNYAKKIWITPPHGMSTATANASNNVTVEIGRTRAGSRVVVGTFTTTTVSLIADTPQAIPVTITDPSSLQPGDLLDCSLTQNASGVALAVGAVVQVEIF